MPETSKVCKRETASDEIGQLYLLVISDLLAAKELEPRRPLIGSYSIDFGITLNDPTM